MNPPLRSASDVRPSSQPSSTAPWTASPPTTPPTATHEKELEFDRAPNGITGLETSLGLALRILHRRHGLSLSRSLALLTSRPAEIVGLHKDRGHLAVGARADILIFNPSAEGTFLAASSRSLSRNSPFDGWPLPGANKLTIVGGVPV